MGCPPDLLDDLERAVGRLARRWATPRTHDRIAARAGIDVERGAAMLLTHIVDHAPITSHEIARRAGLDPSTVSRHVSRLEGEDLVTRSPDPNDARAARVSPTRKGRKTVARLREAHRALLAEILRDWPTEDLEALAPLLHRLAAAYASTAAEEVRS